MLKQRPNERENNKKHCPSSLNKKQRTTSKIKRGRKRKMLRKLL